jgi:hypothetical protein
MKFNEILRLFRQNGLNCPLGGRGPGGGAIC